MTLFYIVIAIVIYLGIAIWATRFLVYQDYTFADSFQPMSVGDAIMLMCFTFTPLSLLIIIFSLFLKLESLELENRYEDLCAYLGKKIVKLANWMFLPREKENPIKKMSSYTLTKETKS